jgi:hypothetical protein
MHAVSVARSASAAHNCPQAFHDKDLVVSSRDSLIDNMLAFKHAVTRPVTADSQRALLHVTVHGGNRAAGCLCHTCWM